jgi:hypothetical protein
MLGAPPDQHQRPHVWSPAGRASANLGLAREGLSRDKLTMRLGHTLTRMQQVLSLQRSRRENAGRSQAAMVMA